MGWDGTVTTGGARTGFAAKLEVPDSGEGDEPCDTGALHPKRGLVDETAMNGGRAKVPKTGFISVGDLETRVQNGPVRLEFTEESIKNPNDDDNYVDASTQNDVEVLN